MPLEAWPASQRMGLPKYWAWVTHTLDSNLSLMVDCWIETCWTQRWRCSICRRAWKSSCQRRWRWSQRSLWGWWARRQLRWPRWPCLSLSMHQGSPPWKKCHSIPTRTPIICSLLTELLFCKVNFKQLWICTHLFQIDLLKQKLWMKIYTGTACFMAYWLTSV